MVSIKGTKRIDKDILENVNRNDIDGKDKGSMPDPFYSFYHTTDYR